MVAGINVSDIGCEDAAEDDFTLSDADVDADVGELEDFSVDDLADLNLDDDI